MRTRIRWTLVLVSTFSLFAQQSQKDVTPHGPGVIRDYLAPDSPPIRLRNSDRLKTAIRAGNLYLTLQDAITIAIENNLDLEQARYGPILAEWALKRAEAGGPIRGVPSGAATISAVDNGLGANGSTAAAGLSNTGNNNGNGGNTGGATIQQIGQITPNLDPNLQNATAFSHQTQPQVNTVVSGIDSLIQSKHTYNTLFQQGLLTGGIFQVADYEQSLKENSPGDIVNPAVGPYLTVYLRHSLLQGFGLNLNNRFIRIGKLNVEGAREQFRSQVLDVVSGTVNLYWDLVTSNDVLKAREAALEIAAKFRDDTKAQIDAGALARVELPRAEAELATRRQDLLIARTTVRQQEILLKQALTRVEDPAVEAAPIVTVDHIEVPADDDLPPLRQLVASAMQDRPDVAISKILGQTLAIAAVGTSNPLLPSLTATVQATDRGFAGTYQPSSKTAPDPAFLGGYGTALGQIFRRDFPSQSAQLAISAPLGNRSAQADYGIDQLQLKQAQVSNQRDSNAIVVAISNQVVALQQARARYTAAANTRELQQQLLEAEQQKFRFGKSSITGLIVAQRALVVAQTVEISALSAYAHARVSLDQVMGRTLEVNHVALDQALDPR